MGILDKDGWDVFSSYSRLDNDVHDDWIKSFSQALRERVLLELRQRKYSRNLDELAFFFDTESMPANGPLERELNEKIRASRFLLLFIGDNYLESEWCGKELIWFSERFSGLQETALKNIFMIMMTPSAVRGATSKPSLCSIKAGGIFQLGYRPPDDTPMPAQLRSDRGVLGRNPDYANLVNKLAVTLADRIVDATEINRTGQDAIPKDPMVTFGLVAPRLKDYRSQLAARVAQTLKIKVDCWDWEDLGGGSEELVRRLANSKLFIQLIDKSPVGFGVGMPPGGILALQKDLVPTQVPLLWIEPTDAGQPDREEQNPVHAAFLNATIGGATKLSADKSVQEIAERLQPGDRPKYAKIMIEHSYEDEEEVFRIRKILSDAWSDVSEKSLPLRFAGAEWTEMKSAPDKFRSCHGIVVIDRSRPYATLEVQLDDIEDELAKRNQELEHRTFVLPPKSRPTIMNWPYIRFQNAAREDSIEVYTMDALKKFLETVKARAMSGHSDR